MSQLQLGATARASARYKTHRPAWVDRTGYGRWRRARKSQRGILRSLELVGTPWQLHRWGSHLLPLRHLLLVHRLGWQLGQLLLLLLLLVHELMVACDMLLYLQLLLLVQLLHLLHLLQLLHLLHHLLLTMQLLLQQRLWQHLGL